MFKKKILILIAINFLISSCADTFDSVKRGLTGAKEKSGDEFLVQKKDPLIMPPDYENLPTPDETEIVEEEISSFEKTLTDGSLTDSENISTEPGSAESSILKKIKNQ